MIHIAGGGFPSRPSGTLIYIERLLRKLDWYAVTTWPNGSKSFTFKCLSQTIGLPLTSYWQWNETNTPIAKWKSRFTVSFAISLPEWVQSFYCWTILKVS